MRNRAEPAQLAELLMLHREALLFRWEARVLADRDVATADQLAPGPLRDHIPALVDDLIALLRRCAPSGKGERVGRLLGESASSRLHASIRHAQGYALCEAVRELSHLREAIMELFDDEGVPLGGQGARLVHAAIDESIRTSVEGIEGATRQTLEKRNAELDASRAQLQVFVDNSSAVIFQKDPDGRYVLVNRAHEELVGLGRESILGKTDFELYPPAVAELFRANDRRVTEQCQPVRDEEVVPHKDGPRTYLTVKFPLPDPVRGRCAVGGVATEITEQVRAHRNQALLAEVGAELARSLDFDATVRAATQLAVKEVADYCIIDLLRGDRLERVGLAARDPRVVELLEKTRAFAPRLTSTSPLARTLVDQRAVLVEQVTDAWLDETALNPEHREMLRELAPRSVMMVPLVVRSRMHGLMNLVSTQRRYDATDLHVAQQLGQRVAMALDNAQLFREAQSSAAELRREAEFRELFLGVLAHDLRNPLAAIRMTGEMLERSPVLPPTLRASVERLVRSTDRTQAMIDQLLDLTRARSGGGIPITRTTADLRAIATQAADELAAARPGREILVDAAGDCTGAWDAGRLLQLFSNLIGNALDHGDPSSPVRVSVTCDGGRARVSVHNRGPQIPAELIPTLFDPFRRGHSQGGARGLGLGLYICDQIARAHGGTLSVTSGPDGTEFVTELPRVPA